MVKQNTELSARANAALASTARLKPYGMLEHVSTQMPWTVFPIKTLDVNYTDLAAAVRDTVTLSESSRDELADSITSQWDPMGETMVTLSVRTGFDLLLQTLNLPEGSEILCSAITLPAMELIIKYHKLVPVPIDLLPDSLAVDVDQLRASVTNKTRAILIAHIYGTRNSLDAVIEIAKQHNLMVIEDCAQAFVGMQYTGDHRADVNMFSFGPVKTSSALGTALITVRNKELLNEMKRREAQYEPQSSSFFMKRVIKHAVLHSFMSPGVYGFAKLVYKGFGGNFDELVNAATRGFKGGDLVTLIRHRPHVAHLGLLNTRLHNVDDAYIELRRVKSEYLRNAIKNTPGIEIPAANALSHYYWIFPIVVEDRDHVKKYLEERAFDATYGTATQLGYIRSPKGPEHDPAYAKLLMSRVLYLPITPETPTWALDKMAQYLKEAVQTN